MDVHKQIEYDASNPPTFPPSIQNLPLLVLRKIFKLLSSPDRESAMRVCVQWRNIIQFDVGLSVFVGNGLVYNFPGHKSVNWIPLNQLRMMGIDKCVFAELSDDDDDDDDDINDERTAGEGFMLPELVRELSFYGKITNKLFRVIMSPVCWLTTLKIHLSVFRFVSFDDYTLRYGCLIHLRIFYTHPVFHLSFPFKIEDDPLAKESIHRNLTKLLNTCFFCHIQTFEFLGPYFADKTENLIDAVKSFVARHQVSLKELALSFPYEWNVEGFRNEIQMSEMSSAIQSMSLSEGQKHLLGTENRRRRGWGNVQLRQLQVVCPATVVPPVEVPASIGQAVSCWSQQLLNEVWRSLLEKQFSMSSIQYINKYEDWTFPEPIIMNNAKFLTVISISVNANFPVDCKALSFCENLVKLSLEGNNFHQESIDAQVVNWYENNNADQVNYRQRETTNNRENEYARRLFNAHLLPESLQEICLSKVMIPVNEMEALVEATCDSKRFQNLRSLQLYQISKGLPQFGLTTIAVQRLLDQSNLSLSFWQALNCTSFENAIGRAVNKIVDAEVLTVMKVLEHCDTRAEDGVTRDVNAGLRFEALHDCHVQFMRKSKGPVKL